MTKFFIFAIALMASAQAHAVNLTGVWNGSGQATDHQGKPINCEAVAITINHTATTLKIDSAFTCEGSKIAIPGPAFEIRGSDLFDKGVKSGSISANAVKILATDKTYSMNTDASFTENAMNIGAVVALKNNPSAPVLSFKGTVRR